MSLDKSDNDSDESESSGGDAPVLTNSQEGAAAWVNTDKNGKPYINVQLPLGLNVNLFPENEAVVTALNHVLDEAGE